MATQKVSDLGYVFDASTGDIIETNTTAAEVIRFIRETSEEDCARVVKAIRAIADGSWPYSLDETKALTGTQARQALNSLPARSMQ